MMQLNVTPDFKKRSLKFKPEFPAAAKLESVELVIPNPDGEIKTAGLSFIIYSARCGGRKLAVCDAFTGTGTITGTLNLCTDRMVDEFYHLPLGTRRSFHAVLWSEADQWMIGAGRIAIANNPGSDSMNPAPLPADRYPTFEEVEEMIRNSGGLDEPVVRRVNGIAPDNAGNVSITIPGDVSELKDKDGLTLTVQQKNTLATLSTTYASKNHTHSEYALKSELPDVSGFITADKLNLYQLKADAFSGKYADLSGKPSAFPPASHTHAVADVNGLADELSRKLTVPAGGNAGQFLMKTVSGCGWSSIDLASYITITQARNEFAAKTHEHSQYALASALQDYAAKVHTHIIGDVTGLQDALDGKAAADHNHDSVYAPKEATAAALNAKLTIPAGGTAGQVIGKTSDGYGWITVSGGVSSWNDLTDKPSAFPPATHNHVIGDVTGLENKLNEKISSVNGQVPNSSGAVTLPVATSKADGLMSAADKEKLDGLDTTGSTGDMLKSVYDTDDDGIVDHAATADAVGATTAAQVADAVGKAHTHANKATLDKLAETDGKLTFDGAEIGGGSGTVKSVNGQLPDESGNVTIETGSTVDESRLLPENPANGDIPCFDATATIGGGNDANTRILLHFDADEIKDEAAGNAAPVTITKKTGTITVVEGGKWGKCAKYVTGSMTVATNLDELNANNWVVSGWFNPDENNHGVSYPTWLSMDDQNTHGFGFDSTGRYGESDGPLFYLDTPPASGTWHWLAIVKYSGGLRFYLNGAFLNEISAQQRANFCSTLAIGGFAGTHAAGSTERTFSGLVDEVRLQYIPDDEITLWTGTSIAVPDAPYSKPQTVGEWGKFNKSELKATRVRILSRDPSTRLVVVQPLRLRNGVWETDPNAPEKTVKY
ncbi:LamG-like jellyroll fold domain-containing protein [Victivallis vadensis]|nr:LamG-like jellyroll fold domain-containing protein [Victivallis vadensis]